MAQRGGSKSGAGTEPSEAPKDVEGRAPRPGAATASASASYTVVARRYRPQRFEDVVGQDHVVRSLRNAVRMNRIAQAYLFCGTRGVGKTTMARIFAKCLNCVQGPTESPCQVCDICQAISQGQDVDVIEIDGASNNGVEQVRELRQNAALRPSRARFKIYYIDEVHMLSTGAFNALLKTLEEPPPHVKFFFATTEAHKIPITVLSRCQRYDLAGIAPELIAKSLGEVCASEGVVAEPEALRVVARRASGSLRDAQSLLDRLLASGGPELTVELVHSLLGTASDERLLEMLEALADHDAAKALALLDQEAKAGTQPTELLGGLLDFLRDAMALALGAESVLLTVAPRQRPRLDALVARWPIDSIVAALQILAEHRTRLRGGVHGRLIVEMGLVRAARLEDLAALGELVDRLSALESGRGGAFAAGPGASKKKTGAADAGTGVGAVPAAAPRNGPGAAAPNSSSTSSDRDAMDRGERDARVPSERGAHVPGNSDAPPPFDLETVQVLWPDLVASLPRSAAWRLSQVEPVRVDAPDVLVIAAKSGYNADGADPGANVRESLEREAGRRLRRSLVVRFERSSSPGPASTDEGRPGGAARPSAFSADPLVQKVAELFEARPVQVDYEGPDGGPQS